MKKYKGLIISAVVAVVLLGLTIWLFSTESINTDTPNPTAEPGMISVYTASSQIIDISLTNPSGTFLFTQKDGSWYLLPDENTPVLTNGITGLVSVLSQVEAMELIEENTNDLSKYGLDAPSTVADYTLSDGTKRTIKLGDDIFAAKYYFTVDDKTVYTMEMLDAGILISGISAYRDMSLVSYTSDDIAKVTYQSNGVLYEVVLRDSSTLDPNAAESLFAYELISPVRANASPTEVKRLIEEIVGLSAKGYVIDPADADLGLDGKTYLTVTNAEGAELKFIFGKYLDEKNIYVQKVGQTGVYVVDKSLVDFLSTDAFMLVDKHVSLHYMDEIKSITMTSGGKTTVIEIDGEHCTVNGQQVGIETVQTFFQDLIGLCYDARQIEEYDRSSPVAEITMVKKDGTVDRTRYYSYDALSFAVEKDNVSGFLIQNKFVEKVLNAF